MITDTMIAWGDQLGAQMTTYACLHYIAKENNQILVLINELKDFRRGYQFIEVFEEEHFKLIDANCKKFMSLYNRQFFRQKDWKSRMNRMYNSKFVGLLDQLVEMFLAHRIAYKKIANLPNGIDCNPTVMNLDESKDYNIQSGFCTASVWDKYRDEIQKIFTFKNSIKQQGDQIWNDLNIKNENTVSVHFRLTDYLIMASLNMDEGYYQRAIKLFPTNSVYVVFSDDIEAVKRMNIFNTKKVVYVDGNSPAVDMYLMTCCKNNIIANSSFSFWGGYLNLHKNKKVVCPYSFIGEEDKINTYLNGHWFPKDWVSINA